MELHHRGADDQRRLLSVYMNNHQVKHTVDQCVCQSAHVFSWECEHLCPAAQLTERSSGPPEHQGIGSSGADRSEGEFMHGGAAINVKLHICVVYYIYI